MRAMISAAIKAAKRTPSSLSICDQSSPKCSDCAHRSSTAEIKTNSATYSEKLQPERNPAGPVKTRRMEDVSLLTDACTSSFLSFDSATGSCQLPPSAGSFFNDCPPL